MAELIYAGDGGIFKTCTKCNEVKPLSAFAKGNTMSGVRAACRDCSGAIEVRRRLERGLAVLGAINCQECGAETQQNSGFQKYCEECAYIVKRRKANAANALYEKSRPPRIRNSPSDKEKKRAWAERKRADDPDYFKNRAAKYNEAHRDEVNRKARERNQTPARKEYMAEWDTQYRAQPKNRIDQRMKAQIAGAIKEQKAGRTWESIVGYTLADLMRHLERQFLPGMTWDNIGKWHIDHRVPRKAHAYDSEHDPDFKACWALTNLQPLWARDNISKGGKRTLLL